MTTTDWRDEFDWRDELSDRVRSDIERDGIFIQYVIGDEETPSWAYTVGMQDIGDPEVVVFGLSHASAAGGLNLLFRESLRRGFPAIGREHEWELGGLPARVLRVPAVECTSSRFAVAFDYYEIWDGPTSDDCDDCERLEVVQLVWADPAGRFPWDDAFDPALRALQPILEDR